MKPYPLTRYLLIGAAILWSAQALAVDTLQTRFEMSSVEYTSEAPGDELETQGVEGWITFNPVEMSLGVPRGEMIFASRQGYVRYTQVATESRFSEIAWSRLFTGGSESDARTFRMQWDNSASVFSPYLAIAMNDDTYKRQSLYGMLVGESEQNGKQVVLGFRLMPKTEKHYFAFNFGLGSGKLKMDFYNAANGSLLLDVEDTFGFYIGELKLKYLAPLAGSFWFGAELSVNYQEDQKDSEITNTGGEAGLSLYLNQRVGIHALYQKEDWDLDLKTLGAGIELYLTERLSVEAMALSVDKDTSGLSRDDVDAVLMSLAYQF